MKRVVIVLFISLLITSGHLFAQDENFLGICLGAALPQGKYAEKNYDDPSSGYANTGFLFTFDASIFPDDYLGIGATVSYGSNNPDKKQFKQDLIGDVLERYPGFADFEDEIYFDYGTWRYLNFHAGPAITIPAGMFNFDIRGMAGLSLVWTPELNVNVELEDGRSFSRRVDNKAIPTLGFTVGGGIRYALRNGYVLRFITEYTNSKPTIEVREDVIDDVLEEKQLTTNKVEMPLKNIHIGIGIAYNFEI
ncbi:MAG: outer membrane beta-barrel protein [Bacteroidales bacterium]|nr:outer membrane beta-barrel protein [Bacteroidales bacterium]